VILDEAFGTPARFVSTRSARSVAGSPQYQIPRCGVDSQRLGSLQTHVLAVAHPGKGR